MITEHQTAIRGLGDAADESGPLIDDLKSGLRSVCTWGSGAIGSSAIFHLASAGVRCIAYDISEDRVHEIRQGHYGATSVEESEYLDKVDTSEFNVTATTDWRKLGAEHIAVHLICVPTERGAEPSEGALADVIPQIAAVIRSTAPASTPPLVSVESTVLPRWIDDIVVHGLEQSGLTVGTDVLVGAAPRRDWFSDGSHTLGTLPRIVGGCDPLTTRVMAGFYGLVCRTIQPALDARHAAFTKVIENVMRYEGISLANRISLAFPEFDMRHVFRLASTKWNIPYYYPSLGVGGHCIPLAPQYLIAEGDDDQGYLDFVRESLRFNSKYFNGLYDRRLKEILRGKRSIGILGLAYTPDAKMHKLSPAFGVLETLRDTPRLRLHDPFYSADEIYDLCSVPRLRFPRDLSSCDAVILVTPHSEYTETSVEKHLEPGTVIIDNTGAWSTRTFQPGVEYYEVGRIRGRVPPASEPFSTSADEPI